MSGVGDTLRVVSYNLHGVSDDRDALVSVLRALRPDVLIAQEAPKRLRWRSSCAALMHAAGLYYVVGGGGEAAGNLIAVSTRLQADTTVTRRLPTPVLVQHRGMVGALVRTADTRLAVFGTHGDLDPARRQADAGLVVAVARAFADEHGVPLVLAADMNCLPGEPAWDTIVAAGLADVAAGSGPTFPARAPSRRIDAVFIDPALAVHGHAIGAGALVAGALVDADAGPVLSAASDHLPVLVELAR